MANFFSRFIKDESGATAIEYGLIASLISVAAIVAFTTVGSKLSATFGYRRRPAQYLSSKRGDKAETIFRPCAGSARISWRSRLVAMPRGVMSPTVNRGDASPAYFLSGKFFADA